MAEPEEKPWMRWNGEFGWSSIFGSITALAIIGTAFLGISSWRLDATNSTLAVTELRNIVVEIQKANAAFSERITRVEEQQKNTANSLDRIERKVDALTAPVRR